MTKATAKKLAKKYKKKGWKPKSFATHCEEFTKGLINAIKSCGKWIKTWSPAEIGGLPSNYQSNTEYAGLNMIACMGRMYSMGYKFNKWVTYKGAIALGGNVKREESKNYLTLSYYEIKLYDADGKQIPRGNPDKVEVEKRRAFFNTFYVYNIEQCEGIEMPKESKKKKRTLKPLKDFEAMVEKYKLAYPSLSIEVKESDRAYYQPSRDKIVVPTMEQFVKKSQEMGGTILEGKHNWARTLLHEIGHSLMKRIAKDDEMLPDNFFKNHEKDYAYEELCAELFSVFMGMRLGLTYGDNMKNSENYLKGWVSALESNPKWIVMSSTNANKRVRMFEGAIA